MRRFADHRFSNALSRRCLDSDDHAASISRETYLETKRVSVDRSNAARETRFQETDASPSLH
jgi:hypothetical protein